MDLDEITDLIWSFFVSICFGTVFGLFMPLLVCAFLGILLFGLLGTVLSEKEDHFDKSSSSVIFMLFGAIAGTVFGVILEIIYIPFYAHLFYIPMVLFGLIAFLFMLILFIKQTFK